MKINPYGKIQKLAWLLPCIAAVAAFVYIFYSIGCNRMAAVIAAIMSLPAFGLVGCIVIVLFPRVFGVQWGEVKS
jgi:hypothetical protein